MTRGQVAARCRREKEQHPERYCASPDCLWRTSSGPCRKHGARRAVAVLTDTNICHVCFAPATDAVRDENDNLRSVCERHKEAAK